MKKKILHLFPAYKIGGGPICILRLIKSTMKLYEHSTIAAVLDRSFYKEFTSYTQRSFNVNLLKFSPLAFIHVLKIILKLKPDIIHTSGKGGALYGFFVRLLSFRQIKMFHTFHGFEPKYTGMKRTLYLSFEKAFNKIVNKSIAVSNSERKFYLKTVGADSSKVIIIPNGVLVKKKPLPQNIQNTIRSFKLNILTLTRISHEKDLITMLKVFDRIPKEKQVSLHIIGGHLESEKAYKESVYKIFSNMKNKQNVFFEDSFLNAGNIIHYFDIYWSTSLFEGLPTAIIEAMMSKVLVLATNCRGNIDLVKHEKTGLLSRVGDENDNFQKLLQAINIVKSDQAQLNQIKENAYNLSQNFTIENNVKQMQELYDQ